MKLQRLGWGLTTAATAALVFSAGTITASAEDTVYIPQPSYRTGPYSVNGIPFANGFDDYLHMLNARDGGVEGVKIVTEECEFAYKTDRGVECYERLKGSGTIVAYSPLSTGVTYKLVPKARVDQIPLLSMGYGMSAAADGRWFPYVFNFPTSYWSQASAFIRFVGEQEGGIENLAGKKIGLIYLESGYGREPIPLLEALGEKYGYTFTSYSVPGKEMQKQQAQWRKIDRDRLDWLFMWGWGVMNRTAIQRATELGFPLDRFIGVWWSGAESDTQPLGELAKGYRAGTFHAAGQCCQVHKDIIAHVYDTGGGHERDKVGHVLYNRGVVNAMYITEAVRDAIRAHGPNITGVEVRDAMENLDLNTERLAGLGMEGLTGPVRITCADHENNGPVSIQEWDGSSWNIVQTGIEPLAEVVRPMLEAAAVTEAEKFGYTMRENCT